MLKSLLTYVIGAGVTLAFISPTPATAQIILASPGFDTIGGSISGVLDLNVLDPAPVSVTAALARLYARKRRASAASDHEPQPMSGLIIQPRHRFLPRLSL